MSLSPDRQLSIEMTWNDLRKLGELTSSQRADASTIAFVRDAMTTVRECISKIHGELVKRGYRFRNPDDAFRPATSDSTQVVTEIESRFGALPLSLRYFWLDVGSVDFCQDDNQLIMWHRAERESASDLQILGEEDPLYVTRAATVLNDLISAEQTPKKRTPGASFGWRKPHMDRWYCHLACDEFHKANYSGGENYNFFVPDSAADFRIFDLFDERDEREWFVSHLFRCIQGGGFRGKLLEQDNKLFKALPKNTVAIDIGRTVANEIGQSYSGLW